MVENWKKFLMPYEQAVSELKIKLRGMRKQYQQNNEHAPIEFVTGRVKPIDSIKEKMQRRYITEDLLDKICKISLVCGLCVSLWKISMKLWAFCTNGLI